MNENTPESSPWIVTTTDATFAEDVIDRSAQVPVVVDFWAAWCQPCRMLGPILERLAHEYDGRFVLVKADTEKTPAAATQFGVQSIPAVYGLRGGKLLDYFVGVLSEEQLRAWIDRLLPSPAEVAVAEGRRLEQTDPAAAEAKYREALQFAPNDAPATIALAEVLLAQDRPDESRALIEVLAARGYLEPEAERVKAALELRQMGEQVGDVEQARAAAQRSPQDFNLQLQLAETLAAHQQYEEALEAALRLVESDRHGTGEKAKELMLDVFRLLPDDSDLTTTYRRRLSTALY